MIGLVIILLGLILFIYQLLIGPKNNNFPQHKIKKEPSISILIPARDESKVISNLLDSIQKQTYKINMKDVYIIIEDEKDKTIKIAKNYNATILFRTNKEKRRKGYALDEGIKQILKIKQYDLYFILDADNILDKDFIKKMVETYHAGYDIGIGYRNSKNGNENVITACSTLTFSMINQLLNNYKNRNSLNLTISGTGFYITGKFINDWKGYPFYTLTEDYELTLYATLNNMTSFYNKEAIFYDEQPNTMKTSIKQRTRWVKGYFMARKEYIPKIRKSLKIKTNNDSSKKNEINIIRDIIIMVVGVIILLLEMLIGLVTSLIKGYNYIRYIVIIILLLLLIYIVLIFVTINILSHENKYLNLKTKTKIKTIFYNPIFLVTYLICVFNTLINKDIEWTKIEHNKTSIT